MHIGIVAPSSQLPQVEFALGVETLRAQGFKVTVHPQTRESHLFFAGTDSVRAQAFLQMAKDPSIDILWCARGGYGATRLLPYFDKAFSGSKRPPHKLLIGYSDATALMSYSKARWGWDSLHGPMPAFRRFSRLKSQEWSALMSLVGQEKPEGLLAYLDGSDAYPMIGSISPKGFDAELVGGNLCVWDVLAGTPYEPKTRGKALFFEDVDEDLYRIDRMIRHLEMAGQLDGVKAVVLGDFTHCKDRPPSVLSKKPSKKELESALENPKAEQMKPLRETYPIHQTIIEIFQTVCVPRRIPLIWGLPVGHGPGFGPLPLGATYHFKTVGVGQASLCLKRWSWLKHSL